MASPLGFSEATRPYLAEVHEALNGAGLEPLDPWANSEQVAAALQSAEVLDNAQERRRQLARLDFEIGEHNLALLEAADAVLAILDGPDVDSGTAAEVGFAAARGTLVVGLRSDVRQTGENDGCIVNLQVEYFIRMTGGTVVNRLEDAVLQLLELQPGSPRARPPR